MGGVMLRFLACAAALLLASCDRPPNSYGLETVVGFGRTGASEKFRASGWSSTEEDATWTDAPRATLKFALAPRSGALGLRMRLSGMTKQPDLPWQPVYVFANGTRVAEWLVWEKADFVAVIRPKLLKSNGKLEIELRSTRGSSHRKLGGGDDFRSLGIRCYELEITHAPNTTAFQPKPGTHATVDP